MRPSENVPLAPLTTFGVGGPARRLVTAARADELVVAVREADARGESILLVGGGSNLLVADEGFGGTAVRIATRGVTVSPEEAGRVLVTADAGEPWDDLVALAVSEGLSGLECLAGIPGLVGATPMQNVGAYGQEVSGAIVWVTALDRVTGHIETIPRSACAFGYRTSAFRGKDRHVILSVTFALSRTRSSCSLAYAELTKALGIEAGASAPLAAVRDTVIALRRKKGMVVDPADPDSRSAGSFFTNPILEAAALAALEARVVSALGAGEAMPRFPEHDGRTKVSAAWLIERAGFAKGFTKGRAAISSKHALALVNRGGATAAEILALAREIRDGVRARFGVELENEPVMVGMSL